MILAPHRHWHEIADCAEGPIGMPLAHRPYLNEALRAVGCILPPDTAGDTLRDKCAELLKQRMVLEGDDD